MASPNPADNPLPDLEAQRENEKAPGLSIITSDHNSGPTEKLSNAERLKRFRERIGIVNPPAMIDSNFESKHRPGQNEGTYKRTIAAERRARLSYRLSASAINMCLLAQLVIGAAQTALGAANASHIIITILGALQTVIAGCLTYMKGQGLPNRLRQTRNEMQKLRVHIEKRERQMSEPGCELDLEQEITIIEKKYEAIMKNKEDNLPDNFVGLGLSQHVGPGGKVEPFPHLPRGLASITPVASLMPHSQGFGGAARPATIGTIPEGNQSNLAR